MAARKPLYLVVEDSPTQAKIIAQMLRDQGNDVQIIATAKDLSINAEMLDTEVTAAFIDVHFGHVNGLRLIDPIMRKWPNIAIVMMTANDTNDYEILAEARRLGAHRVLGKPFTRADLDAAVLDIKSIREIGEPRKHIVVIDDSRTTCRIASDLLTAIGYRASSFQSGTDAIRKLSYDQVDAVITDINMPNMSGREIISLIRDVWEDVGILAMSADIKWMSKDIRADGFLPKPFGPEELANAIRNVLLERYETLDC